MVNDKPEATTHDGSEDIVSVLLDGTELTHEEYIEQLEEMGLDTTGLEDFEGRLTEQSINALAEGFEEFSTILTGGNVNELVEMRQRLEPKHARSPKRHLLHKKAVENRKKRKKGGKK
jgi:hypothetical protein